MEEKDIKDINNTEDINIAENAAEPRVQKDPRDIRAVIAKNISELRVSSGMTQLDLAEKLHYSDKAVSKWERGESVPEISTLFAISELFGVTLDYLVHGEHKAVEPIQETELDEEKPVVVKKPVNHAMITGMSILLVWFIAAFVFVLIDIISPEARAHWLAFAYATPVSMIVWLVLNSIWSNQRRNYLIISLLVWSLLAAIQLTFLASSIKVFQLYILGVPAQLVIVMWSRVRYKKK